MILISNHFMYDFDFIQKIIFKIMPTLSDRNFETLVILKINKYTKVAKLIYIPQ